MAPTTAHRHEESSGRKNAPSLQIPISLCTGIAGNSTVLRHFACAEQILYPLRIALCRPGCNTVAVSPLEQISHLSLLLMNDD